MTDTADVLAHARATWLDARRQAEEAQEMARLAENIANQCFANYADIVQQIVHPGFASFFRRILKKQETHPYSIKL